jgi:hypothetical protein
MAINTIGSFGGGYGIQDGSNFIGMWSQTGILQFGFGSGGGALTSKANIDTAGNLNISGSMFLAQNVSSSTVNLVMGPTGAGTCYLRPNGVGSTAGQLFLASNGALTTSGTANFNTSDANYKTNFVDKEPQPFHRQWFGEYDRIDIEAHGRGITAQAAQKIVPEHVEARIIENEDGTTKEMLVIDTAGIALEQSFWTGREIDKMRAEMQAMMEEIRALRALVTPLER